MKKLLFAIYGFSFFNKFLLLAPVYAIFMQQNGLTDLQLSTMFMMRSVATILGQVPITYLTNHLGQHNAMILGQLLKMSAVLLWLYVPVYTGFLMGMFLWGLQLGFRSVSFEGLMYDSVAAYRRAAEYPRILGRKFTAESAGVILSASGSLLMVRGYDWVTWMSVLSILVSIACLLMIRNRPGRRAKCIQKTQFRKLFRTGLRLWRRTPCLPSVMILTLLVANVPYLEDYFSPIALQIGIPMKYVGIMSFFMLMCATLGQRFAYKLNRLPDWFLYSLIAVTGVGYIVFGNIYTVNALWILGIAYMISYGVDTLLYARFQQLIPSHYRSVILSLFTTFTHIVYIIVSGIIGFGATLGSWRFSIIILGALMICVCIWALTLVCPRCVLDSRSRK